MSQQFERFLTSDNFILALRRLQTANRTQYKNLYYPDLRHFALFEQENIDLTIHKIREGRYEAKPCSKFYIPKKKNLVRPISVLHFIDLLVYQALINVIADELYDVFFPHHNRIIFGNIFRKSNDAEAKFFYVRWQDQWKKYNKQTIEYHNQGYIHFGDFDLASFFDTIDHIILCNILIDYGIENDLVDFLKTCLSKWTVAVNRKNYGASQGIPQGPIASAFLADIYLLPIDKEITQNSKLDLKYFRYVDDIRILSKTEIEGQKAITFLDLITRDFGLIPQAEKIGIRKVDNIKRELNKIDAKFSDINREYIENNKSLKGKTQYELKSVFLDCFKPQSENYLNKTIISFLLFKLNKDDKIKETILNNLDKLYLHFEGVAYYIKTHYEGDLDFSTWLNNQLKEDSILFQYIVALIFKNYPAIPFQGEIFERHYQKNKQFWLTKYYLLNWLFKNEKGELIKVLSKDENYFVNRKLDRLKVSLADKDRYTQKIILTELLKDKDEMLALQALYLTVGSFWFMGLKLQADDTNEYVKHILKSQKDDYINHVLQEKFGVDNSLNFFNPTNWADSDLYASLKAEFALFIQNQKLDASLSLMSLNLFNEMVFDKILGLLGKTKGDNYGGNLEAIKDLLPCTYLCFTKINTTRNERTYAHYKDKTGNLRVKITFTEYERLLRGVNLGDTFKEICNYPFT